MFRSKACLLAILLLVGAPAEPSSPQERSGFEKRFRRGLELLNQSRLEEAKVELLAALKLEPNRPEVHNLLGSIYDQTGNSQAAIRHFNRAIALDPRSAASLNNLGIANLRVGKLDEAVAAFRRALEIDPDNLTGHYNLGLVLLRQGQVTEAVPHLEQARRISPADLGVLHNLGSAYLEQGKPEACVALFQNIPGDGAATQIPEIQLLLGVSLARVGRLAEAANRLETAIRLRPEAPEAYYRLALVQQKKGAWAEARDSLGKAIERRTPPPAEYLLALGEILVALGERDKARTAIETALKSEDSSIAHLALGSLLLDSGSYEQAAKTLERALRKNPSLVDAAVKLAAALLNMGNAEAATERLSLLEKDRTALNSPLYHQVLSSVLARRSEWVPALEALRRATELRPDGIEYYFQMGILLTNAGATQQAGDLLARVAAKYPGAASIQVGLAQVYIARDQRDQAREHLDRAIRLSPEYDEPYFLLGNCHQADNDFEKAISAYSKAVALNPERGDFRFSYALALSRNGNEEKALQEYEKSQELAPSAETLSRIAAIHLDRGALAEAEKCLVRALELEPGYSQCHYLLFRVYTRLGDKSRAARERETFEKLKAKETQEQKRVDPAGLREVDYYLANLDRK